MHSEVLIETERAENMKINGESTKARRHEGRQTHACCCSLVHHILRQSLSSLRALGRMQFVPTYLRPLFISWRNQLTYYALSGFLCGNLFHRTMGYEWLAPAFISLKSFCYTINFTSIEQTA
jgi:hypothetical protein